MLLEHSVHFLTLHKWSKFLESTLASLFGRQDGIKEEEEDKEEEEEEDEEEEEIWRTRKERRNRWRLRRKWKKDML